MFVCLLPAFLLISTYPTSTPHQSLMHQGGRGIGRQPFKEIESNCCHIFGCTHVVPITYWIAHWIGHSISYWIGAYIDCIWYCLVNLPAYTISYSTCKIHYIRFYYINEQMHTHTCLHATSRQCQEVSWSAPWYIHVSICKQLVIARSTCIRICISLYI